MQLVPKTEKISAKHCKSRNRQSGEICKTYQRGKTCKIFQHGETCKTCLHRETCKTLQHEKTCQTLQLGKQANRTSKGKHANVPARENARVKSHARKNITTGAKHGKNEPIPSAEKIATGSKRRKIDVNDAKREKV